MGEKRSLYNVLIALCAAIGSIAYGYLISIVGSTLSKPDWYIYFGLTTTGPGLGRSNAIIAAMQCLFYVGSLIGNLIYPYISDRHGRRMPIAVGSIITICGGALQAGSVNPAMFCVARFISGFGAVFFMCGVPLYQAEISPPHTRGFIVGLHGSLIGLGTTLAQWIGVGFFYKNGSAGWRAPLGIQCVFPAMILGLVWVLPESPRWLYMKHRPADSLKVLIKLHKDKADPTNSFAEKEFKILGAQIDLESHSRLSFAAMVKIAPLRKRLIIGFLTMFCTQCVGTIIILAYGPLIFGSLGYSPFVIAVLFASWTILNGLGNIIGGFLSDKVGRRPLLLIGYAGSSICMIAIAVLISLFAGTTNKAGNSAVVFFIFLDLFVITMCIESTSFIYVSEIFPSFMRSQGVSLAMSGLFAISLILTAVTPTALTNIGWRYYIVFAVFSAVIMVMIFFYWPETKGYTLEQLGRVFGDEVVDDSVIESTPVEHFSQYGKGSEEGKVVLQEVENKE